MLNKYLGEFGKETPKKGLKSHGKVKAQGSGMFYLDLALPVQVCWHVC